MNPRDGNEKFTGRQSLRVVECIGFLQLLEIEGFPWISQICWKLRSRKCRA